jgi:hypothetical protein
MSTDTDLHDLLTRLAESAPIPPGLLEGAHVRRRQVQRRRVVASVAVVAVAAAGGAPVVGHAVQAARTSTQFGAAAGFQHVKGPPGWPSARLAPPVLAPIDGFHGQSMHLDPLPAGFTPKLTAERAYAVCTQRGVCGRSGGAVLTLADLSFSFPSPPIVHRVVWLVAIPPSDCSAAGGQALPAGAVAPTKTPASDTASTPQPPTTRRCVGVSTIDATTGAELLTTADG